MINQFELLDQVGVGAFGSVWKAQDTKLDRAVALKLPRREEARQDDVEQFIREAQSAAQLSHPNIVTVYEVGRVEGQTFIVSEYVEGVSLSSWLTHRYPHIDECVELCSTISNALEHAHSAGVVHRDLKPSNVLLDNSNQPFLTDFGLAKRTLGEVTVTVEGKILGTPAYMAPEQARGEAHKADQRSDLYSLGVMMFQLLTHELPFRGDMRMLLHQVINNEPPAPRTLRKNIPQDLETICMKLLEKDPGRRYQSAREVFDELQRYKRGEPIVARPISRIQRLGRWCRRRPAVTGLILSSLIAAIALIYIVSGARYQQELEVAFEREQSARQQLEESQGLVNELLYSQRVSRAFSEWHAGRLASALRLLNECEEDYRDWEWRYVNSLCHSDRLESEFRQQVTCVAYGPGQDRFVTGLRDGSITFSSVSTGKVLTGRREQTDRIKDVEFSEDGRWMATASADGSVVIRDSLSGTIQSTIEHDDWVTGVDFTPNGELLVTACWDGKASIWEVESGLFVRSLVGHSREVKDVQFSPDGRKVATAGWDKTARIWDTATGMSLRTFQGHSHGLIRILFDPSGNRLITASEDTTAKIWDVESGNELRTLRGHTDAILGLAVSAKVGMIATASEDTTVKLWSLDTGALVRTIPAHVDQATCVEFSGDGTEILTGGWDSKAKIWSVATTSNGVILHAEDYVMDVAVSGVSSDSVVAVTRNGELLRREKGNVTRSQVTRDGDFKYFLSNTGTHVVACGEDGTIYLTDSRTGETSEEIGGFSQAGVDVVFSNDDAFLAAVCRDKSCRVFSLASEAVAVIDMNGVSRVAFDSNTQTFAAASSTELRIVDVATWEPRTTIQLAMSSSPSSISFSQDGSRIAIGSDRGTTSVVDLRDGTEHTWKAHISNVFDVKFLSDDGRLLSVGDDATMVLWNPDDGRPILSLDGHVDGIRSLAISQDGELVYSASEDGTVRAWSASRD